jgi:hypothetical protein
MPSIFCISCHGRGFLECTWCHGNGILDNPTGRPTECPVCDGFGEERCSDCDD